MPARVLVIDDDESMAELIARVARKAGYDARVLAGAKELAEVIASWSPDVITLDLMMPKGDGYDVLSILKSAAYRGRLVIVSGERPALLSGAAAHATSGGLTVAATVRKPIDVKEFATLLGSVLDGSTPAG